MIGIRQWWLLANVGEPGVCDADDMRGALAVLASSLAEHPSDIDPALDLAAALAPYWLAHGDWSVAETWFEKLLAAAHGNVERRGELARTWSIIARNRGELALARRLAADALEFASAGEDRVLVATTYMTAAGVQVSAGDFVEAERLGAAAVETAQSLDDGLLFSRAVQSLAYAYLAGGKLDRARAAYERALDIDSELAPRGMSLASLLESVAMCAFYQRDYAAAQRFAERALERARFEGSRVAQAWSLHRLASIAWRAGDVRRASELSDASIELALAIGFTMVSVRTLEEFGMWLLRDGQTYFALELLASAEQAREEFSAPVQPFEEPDRAERTALVRQALGSAHEPAATATLGATLSLPVALARARSVMQQLVERRP